MFVPGAARRAWTPPGWAATQYARKMGAGRGGIPGPRKMLEAGTARAVATRRISRGKMIGIGVGAGAGAFAYGRHRSTARDGLAPRATGGM